MAVFPTPLLKTLSQARNTTHSYPTLPSSSQPVQTTTVLCQLQHLPSHPNYYSNTHARTRINSTTLIKLYVSTAASHSCCGCVRLGQSSSLQAQSARLLCKITKQEANSNATGLGSHGQQLECHGCSQWQESTQEILSSPSFLPS